MKTRSPRARKHRSRSVTFSPSALKGQHEEAAVAGQQEEAAVAAHQEEAALAGRIAGCKLKSTESDDDTSGPGSVVGDTESEPEGGHDAAVADSRRAPPQPLQ